MIKKNDTVRVTVLMPVYNVESYVGTAIESVLNQTYGDFVLLVLDDASTDGTGEIVQAMNDPRIRYVRNEENMGLADNLNKGVELADTEYIARMDGDDIADPTLLEKQIAVLDTHPEIGICSVCFRFFGAKDSMVVYPECPEEVQAHMLFGCAVIVPMFRKSVFTLHNIRYKASAFPAEDYRVWAECLRVTQVYNIQEVLFHYRMHEGQISTAKRAKQIEKSDEVRLYMLEWLSPDFTQEERAYYIRTFVPGKMYGKEDFVQMKDFARLLQERNGKYRHFDGDTLSSILKKHLTNVAYRQVLELFFEKGYSPQTCMRWLHSGLYRAVPIRLRMKIIMKSVLHKK